MRDPPAIVATVFFGGALLFVLLGVALGTFGNASGSPAEFDTPQKLEPVLTLGTYSLPMLRALSLLNSSLFNNFTAHQHPIH